MSEHVEVVGKPEPPPEQRDRSVEPSTSRWQQTLRDITGGSAMISVLAVLLALVFGGILIALTDTRVQQTAGYFFARPGDMLGAAWDAVSKAYIALFRGSIYNFARDDIGSALTSLTDTLTFATPLIAAGLGVGLAFRVGLFNIGGRGQMIMAAAAAGWIGFAVDLPPIIHVVVAVVAGIIAGGLWGAVVGLLKAKTGAHEVIVTIMLNFVALYFLMFLLRTPGLLQAPGGNTPKTPPMDENAVFPTLFAGHDVHWGFITAIAATVYVWWLLNRSSMGFQFRAVGINPDAARTAGMSVSSVYIWTMAISGALCGLAGVNQVLGTVTTGFSSGIDAGIGFDAITVALLGRSRPWGIFAAGLLFGAFKAGGFTMQAAAQVPIDIVVVVQSMIVLFIAAPPLVRSIFRLPTPGTAPRKRVRQKQRSEKQGAAA